MSRVRNNTTRTCSFNEPIQVRLFYSKYSGDICRCLAKRPLLSLSYTLSLSDCVSLPQQRTVKRWEGLRHLVKRGKEESVPRVKLHVTHHFR